MKLKNIFVALLASLVLFGCEQQFKTHLDEVEVSSSYVGISAAGGQTSIVVTATDSWKITNIPSWLTVTPANGSAGETTVSFKAEKTTKTNEATLTLVCGAGEQLINVIQMTEKVDLPITPVKQMTVEGQTYRGEGTVKGIYNTQYGNWYLVDAAGDEILIYGTLDAKGTEKNFASLGIVNGDKVIVEGPLTIYNGTYELVNVTVIKHTPSLIKVTSDPISLEIEGGAFDVELECKGNGVSVVIPEDAKSWLQVTGIQQNGNAAIVSFLADENQGGERKTTLTFTTNNGAYSAEASVSQNGAILETTADVINAAEDGTAQYRITGCVTKIANDVYGNIYIADATGEVYAYGVLDAKGATKNFASLGIKEGDIVTVVGPKSSYKGTPQMVNVTVEKHIKVTPITVADFLAKPVGTDYYQMTGTVSNIANTVYGNFDIADETGKVYVYGLAPGYDVFKTHNKEFANIGINEGDVVTIIGQRAAYKDSPQVGAAFFVKKEKAE